jgi:hypothetical protein
MHLTVVICRWSTVHRETHEAASAWRIRKYDENCTRFGFSSIGHSSVYYVTKPLIFKYVILSLCVRPLRHIFLSSHSFCVLSEHWVYACFVLMGTIRISAPLVGGAAYKLICKPYRTMFTDSCSVFSIEEQTVLKVLEYLLLIFFIFPPLPEFWCLFHKSQGGGASEASAPAPMSRL